jgi:hypothetical protein
LDSLYSRGEVDITRILSPGLSVGRRKVQKVVGAVVLYRRSLLGAQAVHRATEQFGVDEDRADHDVYQGPTQALT